MLAHYRARQSTNLFVKAFTDAKKESTDNVQLYEEWHLIYPKSMMNFVPLLYK